MGVDHDQLQVSGNKIRLIIHHDRLADLVKLDFVNRVEQVYPDEIANDMARNTLFMTTDGDGSGMDHLSSMHQGKGQTIRVADTGFDLGRRVVEQGVEIQPHPAVAGRVIEVHSIWEKDDGSDFEGHGTHVCASIRGSGEYEDAKLDKIKIQGTAPEARVIMQSLVYPHPTLKNRKRFSTPSDLTDLFDMYPSCQRHRVR